MFEKFRFLTSGESHGECLTAIIEGLPAGLNIDINFINSELKRRQNGYGRGERMKIESDTVKITSGVRFGKTLGSPLTLTIENKDWTSWQKIMNLAADEYNEEKAFYAYRPGHADYAGSIKYNHKDLRNVLERSSARKTAAEVAVGAVAKLLLKHYGITCSSNVLQIGNGKTEEEFHLEIDKAREAGDTLGGKIEVIFNNLPVGLGSYVHWDRALDGRIAQAVMSIPAIKSVSIGDGDLGAEISGRNFHDEMFLENGEIKRKTNHAGGLEGGMTNGEPLVVKAVMKPIPTLKSPLNTVDSQTMAETTSHFERSDTCAVEACAVVAEARIACVLANEIMLKFPSDYIE